MFQKSTHNVTLYYLKLGLHCMLYSIINCLCFYWNHVSGRINEDSLFSITD
jgi:hypothetical protein